jgi:hypothetical protein
MRKFLTTIGLLFLATILSLTILSPAQAAPEDPPPSPTDTSKAKQFGEQACGIESLFVPGIPCADSETNGISVSSILQNTIVKPMADELSQFTADMLRTGLGWWLTSGSIRLGDTGVISDPADGHALTVSEVFSCAQQNWR